MHDRILAPQVIGVKSWLPCGGFSHPIKRKVSDLWMMDGLRWICTVIRITAMTDFRPLLNWLRRPAGRESGFWRSQITARCKVAKRRNVAIIKKVIGEAIEKYELEEGGK